MLASEMDSVASLDIPIELLSELDIIVRYILSHDMLLKY